MNPRGAAGFLILALAGCAAPAGGGLEEPLAAIRAVGPEGAGHEAAARAWRELVARGPEALLPALAAFDGAGPRAANWLRAAVDAIAERALAQRRPLEARGLEAFVRDTRRDGAARRLAYEWLARVDPGAPDRLLPGMLDDPGQELRRDAVGRELARAEERLKAGEKDAALAALRSLLPRARDLDQVNAIARHLKSAGVEVDVQAHFGVIPRWVLISTFDNPEAKGFDVAYPPEKKVELRAAIEGKGGQAVRYVEHATSDPHGKVDLNAALGKEKSAVAYAFAAVESAAERPVEVRVGTNNAVRIFLNGAQVYFRNEYHHGMKMDQYVGRGLLRKGRNEVLLKICQNDQKEDWAQSWSFQARLCDALGGGLPFRAVTP